MPPTPPAIGRAPRAFTLIELLTVIAIIGILAAIIIPTVSKVRDSARATHCLSNLRQISMAFALHASDNKGYFPRGGTPQSYAKSVFSYIPNKGNSEAGVVTSKVFICPAAPQPAQDFAGSVWQYTASFAVEAGNSAVAATGTGSPAAGPRQIGSIVSPSKTVLLAEGHVDPAGANYSCNSSTTFTSVSADFAKAAPGDCTAIGFRHNGSMNVAYVDGHTARIGWADRTAAIPDTFAWNGKK